MGSTEKLYQAKMPKTLVALCAKNSYPPKKKIMEAKKKEKKSSKAKSINGFGIFIS